MIFTPKLFLNSIVMLLVFSNSLLYALRIWSDEWWVGDYVVYSGVEGFSHLRGYLSFLFIVGCFYLFCRLLLVRSLSFEFKNLKLMFYVVVCLFLIQIFFALIFKVGVASSTGSVNNPIFYIVMIFSYDAFYAVYSIVEKNNKRLLIASALFVVSNIVRGWAGFILTLGVVVLVRKRELSHKSLVLLVLVFLMSIPILLHVRDFFRPDGYSMFTRLSDDGYSGFQLYREYFIYIIKTVLTRLDFYSNYIGIEWMYTSGANHDDICYPFEENLFKRIMVMLGFSSECLSLGTFLPNFLYDFFLGKGTSFSVGSGIMALPVHILIPYLLSYFIIFFITVIIMAFTNKNGGVLIYYIYLLFFLLFQGWTYQYIYHFLGVILGLLFTKISFIGNRNYVRN